LTNNITSLWLYSSGLGRVVGIDTGKSLCWGTAGAGTQAALFKLVLGASKYDGCLDRADDPDKDCTESLALLE